MKYRKINSVICEVVVNNKTGLKRWIIREHPEKDLIGFPTTCGVPCAKDLPVGTKRIEFLRIPIR
jgi:hypothetical protein